MKKTLSWCLISTLTLSFAAACSALDDHSAHSPTSDQDTTATTTENHGDDHASHGATSDHSHHHHEPLIVPTDAPAPKVELQIIEDAVQGWNVELQTTNFRFAPENVNKTSQFNEGHAHLYVDGEKIGRLYSPWYHLASLEPGEHIIKVTLNANGHEELQVNQETVADSKTLIVPATE